MLLANKADENVSISPVYLSNPQRRGRLPQIERFPENSSLLAERYAILGVVKNLISYVL